MNIQLTKANNTHHRLACERADDSVEEALLETKSFLVHDFVHLAYETTLGRKESFWGLVAGGARFIELREPVNQNSDPDEVEIMQTEMIVGPLQGYVQGKVSEQQVLDGLNMLFQAHGATLPKELSQDSLKKITTHFHALMGEWNSLGYGETMSSEWKD